MQDRILFVPPLALPVTGADQLRVVAPTKRHSHQLDWYQFARPVPCDVINMYW